MNIHKIGTLEAIALICIVITNQILINIPEIIIQSTGSAAWVNVLFISAIAIGFTLLICKLFEKFVGKDILDICEYVGGKWLKVIIGIAYIALFVIISSTLLQYFTSTLKMIYFHNTPVYIITAIFLLAALIANRIGIKAITNVNLIVVPLRLNKHANNISINSQKLCI